jgi:hypothetical protein
MDLSQPVDLLGVIEDPFGQGGFAGIYVGYYPNIANKVQILVLGAQSFPHFLIFWSQKFVPKTTKQARSGLQRLAGKDTLDTLCIPDEAQPGILDEIWGIPRPNPQWFLPRTQHQRIHLEGLMQA